MILEKERKRAALGRSFFSRESVWAEKSFLTPAANTPLLSPPLPACHATSACLGGGLWIVTCPTQDRTKFHLALLDRNIPSAMVGDSIDALKRNVREQRGPRPERGHCRKWSICDGRQENFFRLQAVLAVNRRPSEARLDSRQGLIKCLKKFLGHRRAQRRQCLGHKPSPFARTPAPTNLNGLPSS